MATIATAGSPLSRPRGLIDADPGCASQTEKTLLKWVVSVGGIMVTLVTYGVLQERIMRVPYGKDREFFKYSIFLVFCNRITTSTAAAGALLVNKKALDPVAPLYKYCAVSVSNILTTTCQYEALKYVSFPVQTLAKCAKMIPVMVWGTLIMQKRYNVQEYLLAVLVTVGCTLFILYPAGGDINPYSSGRESTVWGVTLMMGYLGFDGFTSTFQDKLFRGYNMEIYNQIFYTTLCSCILSLSGLIIQGHLLMAVDFVYRHTDCFLHVILLSTVATLSQFFISYTIRTFGALTFATIMTTRQLVSILLSCIWFGHPLSWEQMAGVGIVFGSLYLKSFSKSRPQKHHRPFRPMTKQTMWSLRRLNNRMEITETNKRLWEDNLKQLLELSNKYGWFPSHRPEEMEMVLISVLHLCNLYFLFFCSFVLSVILSWFVDLVILIHDFLIYIKFG